VQNVPPAPRPRILHAPRLRASSWKVPRDDSAWAAPYLKLPIPARTRRKSSSTLDHNIRLNVACGSREAITSHTSRLFLRGPQRLVERPLEAREEVRSNLPFVNQAKKRYVQRIGSLKQIFMIRYIRSYDKIPGQNL